MRFFPAKKIVYVYVIAGALAVFSLTFIFLIIPSSKFPANAYFTVKTGDSLSDISTSLAKNNIIRSSLIFRGIVSLVFLSGHKAVAGDYFFEKPLNSFEVAWRIIHGTIVLNPIKITIPEGLSKFEIASLIKKNIPSFDTEDFINNAEEGYIFPDTYFFPSNINAYDVIRITRENFDGQIRLLKDQIAAFERPLPDVIKMASILELEANQTETRRIISDILWRRIDIKMPLQVDVSFEYIDGKKGNLTSNDLSTDSPYNSYKYAGLPPTPISNPGLDAIVAALTPEKNKYLYYISDKIGVMHYATTFEQHKKNIVKYL